GVLGSLLSFAILVLACFLLRREVAARTRAEQAQREAEARCRLLFECHPHPMSIYDNETLAFLAVNEAAVYQYGYTQEEFLARTIKDVRPPEDIPALLANVARRTAGFDVHGRVRHQKKDGTIIDVEVTSHAITFAGRPGRLVQAQDITARTRAEAAQRRYAERLQILHEIDRAILAEQFPEAIVSAAIGHIHALLSCWRVNISVFDFVSHQGIVLGW